MKRTTTHLLGIVLLTMAALKLIWPRPGQTGISLWLNYAVIGAEVLVATLLLIPRQRRMGAIAASALFSSMIGFGIAKIIDGGLGAASHGCGCLGSQVEPSRGVMLAVAGLGLALAAWLSLDSQIENRRPFGRDVVITLIAFLAGLVIGLAQTDGPDHKAIHDAPEPMKEPDAPPEDWKPLLSGISNEAPEEAPTKKLPDNRAEVPPAEIREVTALIRGADSGRPIARARVWVTNDANSQATSDVDGKAILQTEVAEDAEVITRTENGTWGRAKLGSDDHRVVLLVSEAVVLSGVVKWENGVAASDFELEVLGDGAMVPRRADATTPTWALRSERIRAKTDDAGRFSVTGLSSTAVSVVSRDPRGVFLVGGFSGGRSGLVWTQLPRTDLELVAIQGRWIDAEVRSSNGDPVGTFHATINWGAHAEKYQRFLIQNHRTSTLSLLWPAINNMSPDQLGGELTARGFENTPFTLHRLESLGKTTVLRMERSRDAAVLRIKNPWPNLRSGWTPRWRVFVGETPVRDPRPAEADGAWIFSGIPPGLVNVKCEKRPIAEARVEKGKSTTTKPLLASFGRVVIRPLRGSEPVTGTLRVTIKGPAGLQISDARIGADGAVHVFPLPAGSTTITLNQWNDVSAPRLTKVEVPGDGESVEVAIQLVAGGGG